MEKFDLIVDNLVKVWRRDKVIIEAETLEEAISYAEWGEYTDIEDTEYLSDTEIYLYPEDANGNMTCEIMDYSGKTLWSNEKVNNL